MHTPLKVACCLPDVHQVFDKADFKIRAEVKLLPAHILKMNTCKSSQLNTLEPKSMSTVNPDADSAVGSISSESYQHVVTNTGHLLVCCLDGHQANHINAV